MSPATPNERPRRGSRVQPPERLGQLGGHAADRVTTHPLTQMGDPSDAGPGAGRRLRLLSAVAGLCAIVGAAAVTWTSVGRPAPDGAAPQSVTADRDHDRVLEVRPGDSVPVVEERLAALGVVDAAQSFASAARSHTPPMDTVEPGFYVVSPGRQPAAVVEQLMDPASRVGVVTVQAGRQLDDVTDPATGSVTPGLLSEIAQATCVPTGGGRRCVSAEDLRQSAAQSDTAALGIPDWARDPVAAMAGDHHRLEGLIGVGRWNVDPTATPAQILSTLISGSAARYDQNSLLRFAAREHGLSEYQVLIVASLLERDGRPGQYRQTAVEIYERVRNGGDEGQLPPVPVTVPGSEALYAAEHPNG